MSRFLSLFLLVGFTHCSANQLRAQAPNKFEKLDERMEQFVASHDLAGAITVIGDSSGIVHLGIHGYRSLQDKDPMKRDTLFRIASMTKPITALAIMQLQEQGKLKITDEVAKHLPEFRNPMLIKSRTPQETVLVKPKRAITIKDLLTHTSGLAPYPAGISDVYTKRNRTLAETTIAVSQVPLVFEPGTRWAYSNSGIDTLGRIVEVCSGMKFEDYIQKNIFDPMGMKRSTFYPNAQQKQHIAVTYHKKDGKLTPSFPTIIELADNPKHPIPAGGLYSTADDLARLYRCLLLGGSLEGQKLLSKPSIAEMTKTQTADIVTGFVNGMSWGLGFQVVKEPKGVTQMLSSGTFGHGGAFGTQGWIDPTKKIFYILLIQRTGVPNGDASIFREEFQKLARSCYETRRQK